MGLYSIKDYLNYYDVAEYLDDMGYFSINFHNQDDVWRYNNLLLKLHKQERLTPVFELNYPRPVNVFYYDKFIDEIDDISDETECTIINQYQKEVDGYCCLGYANFDELLENYLPFFKQEKPKKIVYFYEPYNETLEKNCLIEFLEAYSPVVSHLDILFPKSEIIKIFGDTPYNQTVPKLNKAIDIINKQTKEIETLQAEIDRLQALVGATATPANNKELSSKSVGAVARLIYVLLKMNDIENDTQKGKGKANDIIQAESRLHLKTELSRDFIADWLKHAKEVEYKQKE